jgi:hypothetical protein
VEDFAGDIALEASHDLVFGFAFGQASGDVVAGGLVAAHPHDQDDVQGTVGVAVESVPNGFAAGGFQRADFAEFGEGGVAADPVGVVADRREQRGGGGAAAVVAQNRRCRLHPQLLHTIDG